MTDFSFNIPIYLRSLQEYDKERLDVFEKRKKIAGGDYDVFGKKIEPPHWPPWEFNDIIGYYKIHVNNPFKGGDNINGITVAKYFTNKSRLNRDPYHRNTGEVWGVPEDIWYHKKLDCFNCQKEETKKITLSKVLDELSARLRKNESKTKKYYIDLEYYNNFIELLDWNNLE